MIDTYLDRLIDLALDEDLGAAGDITTMSFISVTVSARVSTGPRLSTIGNRPPIFT